MLSVTCRGLRSRSRFLGTKFFPGIFRNFPVPCIREPAYFPSCLSPAFRDWPFPVPSQSRKWNGNSRIWNFVFHFRKFPKFGTTREFSFLVLKIVIQNKTKQDQGKKFLFGTETCNKSKPVSSLTQWYTLCGESKSDSDVTVIQIIQDLPGRTSNIAPLAVLSLDNIWIAHIWAKFTLHSLWMVP